MSATRIASLLPSATEIVCALGCGTQLVARSHECDHPASATDAPVCTRTRINPTRSSLAIDQAVKETAAAGQPLFEIDASALTRSRPDLILTQGQCSVCAVSEEDIDRVIDSWPKPPDIISLRPTRFAHLWDDMKRVAAALDLPDDGKAIIAEYKQRCVNVIERAALPIRKPSVLTLEWLDPLMSGGNWIPDMVEMAGGENVLTRAGEHSDWIEMDAIVAADPDIIVLLPCGFDLQRTLDEAKTLEAKPGWKDLKAVRKRRVYATDGHAFFNRPGPRLVDSLEILGEIFYPGMIEHGHERVHWRSLY
jgi:iron complex transport system substrate-binding protein